MNPGELNCRVDLQRLIKTEDDSGGYEERYETYAGAWAKLEVVQSRRRDEYEQLLPEILYRVTLRCRPDITLNDRLMYGKRVFKQIAPQQNVLCESCACVWRWAEGGF